MRRELQRRFAQWQQPIQIPNGGIPHLVWHSAQEGSHKVNKKKTIGCKYKHTPVMHIVKISFQRSTGHDCSFATRTLSATGTQNKTEQSKTTRLQLCNWNDKVPTQTVDRYEWARKQKQKSKQANKRKQIQNEEEKKKNTWEYPFFHSYQWRTRSALATTQVHVFELMCRITTHLLPTLAIVSRVTCTEYAKLLRRRQMGTGEPRSSKCES